MFSKTYFSHAAVCALALAAPLLITSPASANPVTAVGTAAAKVCGKSKVCSRVTRESWRVLKDKVKIAVDRVGEFGEAVGAAAEAYTKKSREQAALRAKLARIKHVHALDAARRAGQ